MKLKKQLLSNTVLQNFEKFIGEYPQQTPSLSKVASLLLSCDFTKEFQNSYYVVHFSEWLNPMNLTASL